MAHKHIARIDGPGDFFMATGKMQPLKTFMDWLADDYNLED